MTSGYYCAIFPFCGGGKKRPQKTKAFYDWATIGIEQHYYRETEEQNSNGRKLLVNKDAMLDSHDARERSYVNSANGINFR